MHWLKTDFQFIWRRLVFRSLINISLQRKLLSKRIAWMKLLISFIFPKIRILVNILKNSSLLAYLRLNWSHRIFKTDIWILRRMIVELSLLNQIGLIKMVHVISETFIPKFNIFDVFFPHHLILLNAAVILHLFILQLPIVKSIHIWVILKLLTSMEIRCTAVNVLNFFPNIDIIDCHILRIFIVCVFKYFILICGFLKFMVAVK